MATIIAWTNEGLHLTATKYVDATSFMTRTLQLRALCRASSVNLSSSFGSGYNMKSIFHVGDYLGEHLSVSASQRLSVSASQRLSISASQHLSVSASQRLSISASQHHNSTTASSPKKSKDVIFSHGRISCHKAGN